MRGAPRQILEPYIGRVMSLLRALDPDLTGRRIARMRATKDLRLEAWEISAFKNLHGGSGSAAVGLMQRLFTDAAALRIKIDEEATELSAMTPNTRPPDDLSRRVEESLAIARELDNTFNDLLNDEAPPDADDLDHLYRSRFRLLRSFSGLWLIYDQHVRDRHVPPRE